MRLSRYVAVMVAGMMLGSGLALAKLPAPTEEQKKAAEEKKAKDAEGAKKTAEALAKSQDQVAERHIKEMKAKGVEVKPTPIAPPAAAASASAAVPAPQAAAAPARPEEPKKK